MEFNDVIKNRYSCLAFTERGVEKEKLDHILEVGRIEGLETMGDEEQRPVIKGGVPRKTWLDSLL